jgi:hypothetical protein
MSETTTNTICPRCRELNPDDHQECNRCGAALSIPQPPIRLRRAGPRPFVDSDPCLSCASLAGQLAERCEKVEHWRQMYAMANARTEQLKAQLAALQAEIDTFYRPRKDGRAGTIYDTGMLAEIGRQRERAEQAEAQLAALRQQIVALPRYSEDEVATYPSTQRWINADDLVALQTSEDETQGRNRCLNTI